MPKPARMSAAEWSVRQDLAACYRLVAHFGMDDIIYTHISARVPDSDGHFLINPYGMLFREITASSLVKVDLDGKIIDDTDYDINPAGFTIHSAVHSARHDAACVLHTHTYAGVAVSSLKDGLHPCNQWSLQFHDRIAYHDYEGIALNLDERSRLIQDLGQSKVMILRNHGLLTAGASIAEAFILMNNLERSCRAQITIQSTGQAINPVPEEVAQLTARQYEGGDSNRRTGHIEREWAALLRYLEPPVPGSYRD